MLLVALDKCAGEGLRKRIRIFSVNDAAHCHATLFRLPHSSNSVNNNRSSFRCYEGKSSGSISIPILGISNARLSKDIVAYVKNKYQLTKFHQALPPLAVHPGLYGPGLIGC